jgi:GR25 family glycosyltransferase involved in LPS biosynthesis
MITANSLVDGVFYINLDHRTDRKTEIEGELEKMGLVGERFPGIPTRPGIIGCGYSHLGVLKEARKRGYSNVLIFEDDFQFLVEKKVFWDYMKDVLADLPSYDVIMLGYNIQKMVESRTISVNKILEAQTASGYIVHSKFYDALINLYEEAMPLLESTGQHWLYANDAVWKKLQPSSEWYSTSIRIGKQRASIGETGQEPVFCDYGV